MIKVIAEIGWNHCGDMQLAKDMAKAAKDSGATYAKYQTWSVNRLKSGSWDDDGRRQIYEKAELSKEDHIELINYCNKIGIKFLSSVFSIADAKLLVELGCKEVKIPSFESRNHDLILFCNLHFKTVFMSTGTSTLKEIKQSEMLRGDAEWVLMHCVSTYPCDPRQANILKMKNLMKITNSNIGYSDHIQGVESAKVAIGEGAEVIEKHFTINNDLPGRDNKFSILPSEMLVLSKYIKEHEKINIFRGEDYQDIELDVRKNYRSRWSKK